MHCVPYAVYQQQQQQQQQGGMGMGGAVAVGALAGGAGILGGLLIAGERMCLAA